MWKTNDGFRLRRRWGTGLIVLSSACTGVSSLPSGGPGGTAAGGPGAGAGNPQQQGGGAPGGAAAGNTGAPGNTAGAGMASGTGNGGFTMMGGTNGAPAQLATGPLDTDRVTMRRLNVTEYANTIRDLLGTSTNFVAAFPGENYADFFNTIGTSLSYSDALFQAQYNATVAAISELLARPVGDPIRSKIMLCEPTAATAATCYTQILTAFTKNAWRRPATAAEVQTIVTSVATATMTAASDPIEGIKAGLESVLLSPYFLYHVELGAPNYSLTSNATTPLSDYEVASRLSYFLWSTMPDATLTAAADMSMLANGGSTYDSQITRMLLDTKASSLTTNFAGLWLGVPDDSMVSPDAMIFPSPTVDNALLASFAPETQYFFNALLTGDLPITELVTADYSYVNGRLATHYGLNGVPATQTTFTKASLAGTARTAGILTQETFLTTTSAPDRTSPVKRGAWVLDRMLCSAPPAPPPNVPLLVTPMVGTGKTVRQALDAHASVQPCAGCHTSIDPVGYTFENFNAIGAYETKDNGTTIDASGALGSTPVTGGAAQMGQLVAKDPRFTACAVKQALTYGLGRTFDTTAAAMYVASVAQPLQGNGTWKGLIHAVATSEAFLTTRGGP